MEHLSDASFLGKLLVLPANVRLVWKVIARYKHSRLFGLIISNKEKKVLRDCHLVVLLGDVALFILFLFLELGLFLFVIILKPEILKLQNNAPEVCAIKLFTNVINSLPQ